MEVSYYVFEGFVVLFYILLYTSRNEGDGDTLVRCTWNITFTLACGSEIVIYLVSVVSGSKWGCHVLRRPNSR